MSSVLLAVTVILLFLVLLACISFAIDETGLRRVNPVLAPAATVLCLLAMFGGFGSAQHTSLFDTVLIPWAALGISILFLVLLCLIRKLRRGGAEGDDATGDYERDWRERRVHDEEGMWREHATSTSCKTRARTRMRSERIIGKNKANEF